MNHYNFFFGFKKTFYLVLLVCCGILCLHAAPCFSAIYYVDASNGADTNDGLKKSSAWKTLKKVEKSSFSPGDFVLFKSGEVWNEQLEFNSSGNKGNPITLGAYGTGAQPKFTHSSLVTGWSSEGNGVYSKLINAREGIFEDGQMIPEASDKSCTDGNWHYSNGKTYYKPTFGSPNHHELLQCISYYLIKLDKKSYINIENIQMTYSGGGIHVYGGSHISIKNCNIVNIFGWAIQLKNTEGYCSATDNTITNVIDGIYLVGNPGDHHILSNNIISHCNYGEYNKRDGHGIGLQNTNNNIILNNIISFCRMAPIGLWVAEGKTGNNNLISYNRISNNKKSYTSSYFGTAISITSEEGGITSGNQVYYNIIETCNVGIKLSRNNIPGNLIYNNTFFNCIQGIKLSLGADNNIIVNNIFFGTEELHVNSQHQDVGNNNKFDANCYYPDIPNGFKYKGYALKNFSAWKTKTGSDSKSFVSDPLFVDFVSFILRPESPCIDSGINVQLLKDFNGISVPQMKTVDIGANEYLPSSDEINLSSPKRLRIDSQ